METSMHFNKISFKWKGSGVDSIQSPAEYGESAPLRLRDPQVKSIKYLYLPFLYTVNLNKYR